MVKKLSEKQFTNMNYDTFTIYFNYNLLDCMENAVVLTWVWNLKLWILNTDVSISFKQYDTKKPLDFRK